MTQANEPGSPIFWLERLLQQMSNSQSRYEKLDSYAKGEAPLPNGDKRYVRALRDLQEKARTNYIGLVLKATTQRMRVRDFKFKGTVDDDAKRVWKANNLDLQSTTAISDAAKFGATYALVSPPEEEGGMPVVTIEDPRWCAIEPDPVNRLRSLAGLKLYEDYVQQVTVAVLYLPDYIYVYHGGLSEDGLTAVVDKSGRTGGHKFELKNIFRNVIGAVPLIRGLWQPDTGLAECEDGALNIQDRINHTLLDRLIISKNQAYRQRLITGYPIPQKKDGTPKPPFDPGSDAVWITESKETKIYDLEQADITQLLEAVRDDVGDLASTTQTPVTYLTNRMVNVSGDALSKAQSSHVAKVQERMSAMGWFFLMVIRLSFAYVNNSKAKEIDAEVQWFDPEVRTLAELADLVSKFSDAGVPMNLILERAGFTPDEIDRAMVEIERREKEERKHQIDLKRAAPPKESRPEPFGS